MLPFFRKASVHVRVVHRNDAPCLLAAFSESAPPLIWQFDLEKMVNHTITLREKEGEWDLGLVGPEEHFSVIAHFEERGSAEKAYQAVEEAMIKGETNSFLSGVRWLILLLFFGLFLFFLAGTFLGGAEEEGEPSLPQQTQNRPQETTPQIPQYGAEEDGSMRVTLPPEAPERREMQTGVPMSADEVLEAPKE